MSQTLQAFACMAAVVIVVFAWLHYRIPKAMANDIARYARMFEAAGISGEVEWNEEKHAFAFEHAGRSYELRFLSEGSSYVSEDGYVDTSSTWASLETRVDSKGNFSLRRKGATERLLRTIGLTKSIPSGDQRFDDHFMIASETPEFASTYFSDGERRRAARSLFGQGYTGISQSGGTISLCWIPFSNGSSAEDGPLLRAGLDSIKSLTGNPSA
ncbi:MAG: hypothetical protein HYX59_14575 [Elusimicrobia bacterium]|nr:hypothetical protein [Elusimicrobiota bacterium]